MKKVVILVFSILMIYVSPLQAMDPSPRVVMETTKGAITIELNQEKAPKTVANFLAYVDRGFYDGTLFHRVIKGFMIQGGGMTPTMTSKPADPPIKNEADNGLKNSIGTIAMARTPYPHSATSQFFINTADNVFLNHKAKTSKGWGYCVFGHVIDGMDVVRAIEQVRTGMRNGHQNVPIEPVVIKSVKRVPAQAPSVPTEEK